MIVTYLPPSSTSTSPETPSVPRARSWWAVITSWGITCLLLIATLMVAGRLRAPDLEGTAPHFSLTALDGTQYTLADLKGRTIVLNFWATWCGPCRFELPMLARWSRSHPDVVMLGVAVDHQIERLRSFVRDQDLPYPIVWDDAHVMNAYGIKTLPTTVVIGPDLNIEAAHTGILFGPELDFMLP